MVQGRRALPAERAGRALRKTPMRAIPDLPRAMTFRNVPANRDASDKAFGTASRPTRPMKNPSITANDTSNIVWIDDEAQPTAHCDRTVPVPDHGEFTIGELAREFGVTLRAL